MRYETFRTMRLWISVIFAVLCFIGSSLETGVGLGLVFGVIGFVAPFMFISILFGFPD